MGQRGDFGGAHLIKQSKGPVRAMTPLCKFQSEWRQNCLTRQLHHQIILHFVFCCWSWQPLNFLDVFAIVLEQQPFVKFNKFTPLCCCGGAIIESFLTERNSSCLVGIINQSTMDCNPCDLCPSEVVKTANIMVLSSRFFSQSKPWGFWSALSAPNLEDKLWPFHKQDREYL